MSSGAYLKEVNFYSKLRDEMHEFMPCPKIYGTFKGESDSQFCIAMEDMTLNWTGMSIPDGVTLDDSKILVSQVAHMHAHYWKSPILTEEWLNIKDDEGNPQVFFLSKFVNNFAKDPKKQLDDYLKVVKEGTGHDFLEDEEIKNLMELFSSEHAPAMI